MEAHKYHHSLFIAFSLRRLIHNMEYTADDIKIIRGLSPIRKKPELYFGLSGRDICHFLLKSVLESLIESKYCSKSSNIQIKALSKGGIRIRYDGKGMPIDQELENNISHPIIYKSIMRFTNGAIEPNFEKNGHLSEIGPLLAAMSQELTITTLIENSCYSTSFEYGAISSPLSKIDYAKENEIYIVFAPELITEGDISPTEVQELIACAKERFPNTNLEES